MESEQNIRHWIRQQYEYYLNNIFISTFGESFNYDTMDWFTIPRFRVDTTVKTSRSGTADFSVSFFFLLILLYGTVLFFF